MFCNLWVRGTSSEKQLLKRIVLKCSFEFSTFKCQPIPKSPKPPAMAAAVPGNIEVPTVAAEKMRAAPLVTIGNTTMENYGFMSYHINN